MTRSFSLTMQAYRLDQDRLWMVLLAVSTLMALVWVGWAATDRVAVYETSISVQLTPQVSRHTAFDQQEHVSRSKARRQRWLEARFPKTARASLKPGQEAIVFFQGDTGKQAIAALTTEVSDGDPVRVLLRADVADDAPDPFEDALPERVKVAVGTVTPLELLLPALAPGNKPPAADEPPIRQ